MELKVMRLTEEQQAELQDAQAEIMQMFEAHQLGVIVAQIIPPMGVMRVRVLGPDIAAKLAGILPIEWANEGYDEPMYEVVRSSGKWNAVLGALTRLYELHNQPHETDTHMAVEELMNAFDEWLD